MMANLAKFIVLLLLAAGCRTAGDAPLDSRAAPFVEAMYAAFDRGEYSIALASSDSALKYAPDNPDIEFIRGRILTSLRQYEKADVAYAKAIAAAPDVAGVWYQRGHNAFMQRRYREALAYYMKEEALTVASGGVRDDARAGQFEAAPTVAAQIGRTYALLGVPDSARMAYEKALAADSLLAVGHAWLSELLDDQGEVEQALVHARIALEEDPGQIEYGYHVGQLLFQMGRAREALPYFSRVVQFWPGHEGANFNLGRTLQVLGQIEEGQVYIDRVEELQMLQERAMMAERGVETYPEDPERWIELAGYLMQMGYRDRAEEALNAALVLDPTDLSLQSDLAGLAFAKGDTATAVSRYQALLRQDSTFTAGWLNLGVMYAMLGDHAAAREAWQTVLRHDPEDKDARAYLQQLEK